MRRGDERRFALARRGSGSFSARGVTGPSGYTGRVMPTDCTTSGTGSTLAAEKPVRPKKAIVIAGAGLLGLLLGTAVAFVRRSLSRGVENTTEIEQIVADGEYYGMQTFDQSLAQLLADGLITLQEALQVASNTHDLRVMLERRGLVATGSSW